MRTPQSICRTCLRLWATVVFLSFHCTSSIPCDVKPTAGGMRYSVPAFKGTHCDYFWKNATNHMLASNLAEEVDKLVVNMSDCTLLTTKCEEEIRYRQDCQEKIREAICNTTCSGNRGLPVTPGDTRHHWLTVAMICILVLVLGLIWSRRKRADTAVRENDGPEM